MSFKWFKELFLNSAIDKKKQTEKLDLSTFLTFREALTEDSRCCSCQTLFPQNNLRRLQYKSIFNFGDLRIEFWAELSCVDLSLITILVGFGTKEEKNPRTTPEKSNAFVFKRNCIFFRN